LSTSAIFAVGIVLALFIGLVGLQQADRVFASLETIWNFDREVSLTSRWALWGDTIDMIKERPLRGFGLNTFGWVLPRFQSSPTSLIFMHAHNEYLELIAETGAIGAAIVAWFLVVFFGEGRRRLNEARQPWQRGVHLAGLTAWVGILVFSLTDFPTIIPAINYVLAVLAALATTRIEPSGRDDSGRR
jgi:O-antigen ligase